jgi:transcriptional regulator with XRE-family HTH domain
MSIGDRLREERERLDLSQVAIAALAGVSRVSQGNYESGKRKPKADYWNAVASIGVDVQYVLTGTRSDKFEAKLRELGEVTQRVVALAEALTPQPDPIKLGKLRDIAFSARLTDAQIRDLLDMLLQAREHEFWLQ